MGGFLEVGDRAGRLLRRERPVRRAQVCEQGVDHGVGGQAVLGTMFMSRTVLELEKADLLHEVRVVFFDRAVLDVVKLEAMRDQRFSARLPLMG